MYVNFKYQKSIKSEGLIHSLCMKPLHNLLFYCSDKGVIGCIHVEDGKLNKKWIYKDSSEFELTQSTNYINMRVKYNRDNIYEIFVILQDG